MEELKIVLSLDEVNLVLGGLSELPYKSVNGVINKITSQAESQLKANRTPVEHEVVNDANKLS